MSAAAVSVTGLRVEAPSGEPIIDDVSFMIKPGETLGLVGESGSGKTTTALSLLGYTHAGARITAGEIRVGTTLIDASSDRAMRRLRGRTISYVPQNPGTALNPSMRIGSAIGEMLRTHRDKSPSVGLIESALARVGLPGGAEFQRRYPHQLSGGQQQRVCISIALVCEPPVVVLDEPTTGLDVVTQARILAEVDRLRREQGLSMLYVTHDLAVVAQIADRIAVMYAGRIIEQGPAREILRHPRHPYTRGLLTSIPDHARPSALEAMAGVAAAVGDWPAGCAFAPRCPLQTDACVAALPRLRLIADAHQARCLYAERVDDPAPRPLVVAPVGSGRAAPFLTVTNLRAEYRTRREAVIAASDVSFTVAQGECVALVGESGSGKTTIARTIAGLHRPSGGEIRVAGDLVAPLARQRSVEQRRVMQIIFQNPSDALNPRQTVGSIIARPARILRRLGAAEAEAEVADLLDRVRLPQRFASRYPGELSGGERQRVGIARALAAKPDLIICDEITSALDVSVQAAVLALLGELRHDLGLAMLLIAHDLGIVASIADHVLVLDRGLVCEQGRTSSVLRHPTQPYTRRLVAAAPSISHALEIEAVTP